MGGAKRVTFCTMQKVEWIYPDIMTITLAHTDPQICVYFLQFL